MNILKHTTETTITVSRGAGRPTVSFVIPLDCNGELPDFIVEKLADSISLPIPETTIQIHYRAINGGLHVTVVAYTGSEDDTTTVTSSLTLHQIGQIEREIRNKIVSLIDHMDAMMRTVEWMSKQNPYCLPPDVRAVIDMANKR